MFYVAVDAMSGDLDPRPAIEGTVQAVREWNIPVILVGNEEILTRELKKYEYDKDLIIVENATDVIRMDESPSKAVKERTNASVVVCANLVKKGEAIGFFLLEIQEQVWLLLYFISEEFLAYIVPA